MFKIVDLDKGGEEVWPHLPWQLCHGYQLDALGGRRWSEALCAEAAQHVVLRVQSHLLRHLQPSLLVLRPQALVVRIQEVLQLDASLLANHSRVGAMVKHIGESLNQLQKEKME